MTSSFDGAPIDGFASVLMARRWPQASARYLIAIPPRPRLVAL
ncbi:hypothetical protein [Streptomyces rapamycinicus]|uniref:Uncharacterized protein n=2 Tax=Streptomyces rapamycinicus TaxID=1226757 RepID=A0A0A0N5U3_STRRN|nr:hypothetical protein [Streptomyces rapamycinicus]AGP52301.1 hypothetical protein M271_03355 [Streptomyces rapamycinicus NRRL 5491]MBB4779763.1 hypothetical protein [Streptomyces rapamycinicus]RLV75579.1 hypothetical protein D3C57_140175 [Streptomyces rapamycinicus NRRL 5491]